MQTIATTDVQTDLLAVTATTLDYAEGWYSGNAERMGKSLHPQLAKRAILIHRDTGQPFLHEMTAQSLIEATGNQAALAPEDRRQHDIRSIQVVGNAALVTLEMQDWFDFLQLVKLDGQWKIINVLWQLKG